MASYTPSNETPPQPPLKLGQPGVRRVGGKLMYSAAWLDKLRPAPRPS